MDVNDQLHAPTTSPHDRQLEEHQGIIAKIKIPYLRGMKPQLYRLYKVTLLSGDLSVRVKEGPMPILWLYHNFIRVLILLPWKMVQNFNAFYCLLLCCMQHANPKYSLVKLFSVLCNDRFNHVSKPATEMHTKIYKPYIIVSLPNI